MLFRVHCDHFKGRLVQKPSVKTVPDSGLSNISDDDFFGIPTTIDRGEIIIGPSGMEEVLLYAVQILQWSLTPAAQHLAESIISKQVA